ncbi:MAG: hypothetical protein M1822_003360 [Bathelium mastoideum]|nr:MAG: hypothetical protein M1822_003360 [Bathelium mastoideum]
MLPSKAPSRPRIGPANTEPVTINYQQVRYSQHTPTIPPPARASDPHSQAPWHTGEHAASRARSQIEALPPNAVMLSAPRVVGTSPVPAYNPSMRHPVFFTERLRKPPFQLPLGPANILGGRSGSAMRNPCAEGYVYEDQRSTEKRSDGTRL